MESSLWHFYFVSSRLFLACDGFAGSFLRSPDPPLQLDQGFTMAQPFP